MLRTKKVVVVRDWFARTGAMMIGWVPQSSIGINDWLSDICR